MGKQNITKPIANNNGPEKPGDDKPYIDEQGNTCIGAGCLRLRVPTAQNEPIAIDISKCSDEIKKQIAGKIIAGGETDYIITEQRAKEVQKGIEKKPEDYVKQK